MAYHCGYFAVFVIYLINLASSAASTNTSGPKLLFYNVSRKTTIPVTCPVDFRPVIIHVRSLTQNISDNTMSQMPAILNSFCWMQQKCHIEGKRVHGMIGNPRPENWELRIGIMCVRSKNVISSCTQRRVIEGTGVIVSHGYPYHSKNSTNCSVHLSAAGTIQLSDITCGHFAVSSSFGKICQHSNAMGEENLNGSNLNIFYQLKRPYGYKGFLFFYKVTQITASSPGPTADGPKQKKLVTVLVAALGIVVVGVSVLLAVCHIGRKWKRSHTSSEASRLKEDNDYDYISLDRLVDHVLLSPSLPPPRTNSATSIDVISVGHVTDDKPKRSEDGKDTETIEKTDVAHRTYHLSDASAIRFSADAAPVI